MKKEIVDTLITSENLHKRIEEVAQQINKDYAEKGITEITLIGVLKGAVLFMVDLSKHLNMDVKYDFIDVSSYEGGTDSTGTVTVNKDLEHDIEGKHVIIVEDIIDTGRSLKVVEDIIKAKNPASYEICALLDKPERRVIENVTGKYIGFTIDNVFVIGYGLDYDQRYRNLNFVGTMRFE